MRRGWQWSLALALACVAGCSTLSYETAQEVRLADREVSRKAAGASVPTISFEPTSRAWIVTATQPYEITIDEETRVEQRVRRYLFWPPAVLPGLVHCPMSSLLYVVSAGHYDFDKVRLGCHRLMMLEPLEGTAVIPSSISHRPHTEVRVEPLRNGHVEIFKAEEDAALLSVPLNDHGVGLVPMDAFAGEAINGNTKFEARLFEASHLRWTASLTFHAAPIAPPSHRRHATWPIPSVFQVGALRADGPDALLLQSAITDALLAAQQCVVAEDTLRKTLVDELMWAVTSHVNETEPLGPGNWTAPTVLLSSSIDKSVTPAVITLTFTDLRTADIVAVQRLPWPTSGFQPLSIILGSRLSAILPRSGQTGCSIH